MPKITSKDLRYKYSKTVTPGDDPKKTQADSKHLSRAEEYEVIKFLNSFSFKGGADMAIADRQAIEWMIQEHMPSNIQGQKSSTEWVEQHYISLRSKAPV
ncbi:hypothetical protein [Pseudomonas nitroreducens]|uniref:Uncharacterized protein n=1 Tax=Pseudomonas nitroreducens TaxID=46680 RepID=A0A6G6IVN2_PSENT|nr:hypothetical protein [Pseudomonas nitroreducens]QIE84983.1 hypothetical protein G5B91_01350 [Pseudomonas nitroreducens]QIE87003.1 hypothetical protein G5B91_12305 [Pseudomonas nitroreducens]